MTFDEILGHETVKSYLADSIRNGRIAHAQLFSGAEGAGVLPMAIAYATQILCMDQNENCLLKCQALSHPDLHFAFPVNTNSRIKKDPVSSMFMDEWRDFLKQQPYGNLFDWYKQIDINNKQGNISVKEARDIASSLSLKSFEGGHKVMIIWMAEKMNIEASNKLLKLLEEPPQKTIFILVVEDETQLLDTIRSRCQITHFGKLSENAIKEGLKNRGLSEEDATRIALQANGNFNKALSYAENKSDEVVFEKWFIHWVRTAFRARGNKTVVHDLAKWSEEVSSEGREVQKQFLQYCMEVFRQALLLNYRAEDLVYLKTNDQSFDLRKFAPFVHGNNIQNIQKELEKAIFHIERNTNSKMVLMDLSIHLTRFLHTPKE